MTQAPTRDDIEQAAGRIGGRVRRTPVIDHDLPDGRSVVLKLEQLQHAGSFKPRGAFNVVLSAPETPKRLVAASGGNHGLAVAHVGRTLGIPALVFVPETTPEAKVAGIRSRGAEAVLVGTTYAEARAASEDAGAEPGSLRITAYESFETAAGQGTLARELEQQAELDAVLVAVGGGGLIGGVAAWYAGTSTSVVAVEPTACPSMHDAMAAGRPVPAAVGGIAASALGATQVGDVAFASVTAAGVGSVLVDDDAIADARDRLWRDLRLAVEPAGAAALAALLSGAYPPSQAERVGVVVCGANADPSDLPLA